MGMDYILYKFFSISYQEDQYLGIHAQGEGTLRINFGLFSEVGDFMP